MTRLKVAACGCLVSMDSRRVTCGKPECQKRRKLDLQRERRVRCSKLLQYSYSPDFPDCLGVLP